MNKINKKEIKNNWFISKSKDWIEIWNLLIGLFSYIVIFFFGSRYVDCGFVSFFLGRLFMVFINLKDIFMIFV